MMPIPRRPDWSHLALLAFFAAVTGWYLFDTVQASRRVENLIFVVPLAAFALLMCLIAAVRAARPSGAGAVGDPGLAADTKKEAPASAHARDRPPASTIALMAAFAVYVAAMDTIGFDIASLLFIGAALWIQGERRWTLLLVYTPLFALGVTWGFKQMLPYPMPTTLF
jgi:hypothetical protein